MNGSFSLGSARRPQFEELRFPSGGCSMRSAAVKILSAPVKPASPRFFSFSLRAHSRQRLPRCRGLIARPRLSWGRASRRRAGCADLTGAGGSLATAGAAATVGVAWAAGVAARAGVAKAGADLAGADAAAAGVAAAGDTVTGRKNLTPGQRSRRGRCRETNSSKMYLINRHGPCQLEFIGAGLSERRHARVGKREEVL